MVEEVADAVKVVVHQGFHLLHASRRSNGHSNWVTSISISVNKNCAEQAPHGPSNKHQTRGTNPVQLAITYHGVIAQGRERQQEEYVAERRLPAQYAAVRHLPQLLQHVKSSRHHVLVVLSAHRGAIVFTVPGCGAGFLTPVLLPFQACTS